MSEKTDNMNYCCDCEYAVKKGLFLKTWYCTCQEKNHPYPVRDYVTGEPALSFGEMIPSKVILMPRSTPLMPSFKTCEMARHNEQEEPCPYFELKGFAMKRKFRLPPPRLPERNEMATQANDAACLMNQKQKDLEAENKRLRFLITEIREFLIGGAIPGKIHLKQEHIRDIYTVASEEDESRGK